LCNRIGCGRSKQVEKTGETAAPVPQIQASSDKSLRSDLFPALSKKIGELTHLAAGARLAKRDVL